MQQQLLQVGVQINDALMCKPLRGLEEIDLLLKDITVPNSVIDLMTIVGTGLEGSSQYIRAEKSRMK